MGYSMCVVCVYTNVHYVPISYVCGKWNVGWNNNDDLGDL